MECLPPNSLPLPCMEAIPNPMFSKLSLAKATSTLKAGPSLSSQRPTADIKLPTKDTAMLPLCPVRRAFQQSPKAWAGCRSVDSLNNNCTSSQELLLQLSNPLELALLTSSIPPI